MSSINLVSEEMVLQESVVSGRAKRDPAGREEEARTICLERASGAGLHVELESCSLVGCAQMLAF